MGEAKETERRIADQSWWCIDVGNTHVKTALIVGGRIALFKRSPSGEPQDLVSWGADPKFPVALASVNPRGLAGLLRRLKELGVEPSLVLESDGGVFRSSVVAADVATPETTGVDRVLGCLGALAENDERTAVVVDCGTATTINVMTPDRCFRGGMIAPGRRLLANALHAGTASLPEILPGRAGVEIGKSTKDGMDAGVAAAFIGAIRECTATVLANHPNANIFLTGGDASFASTAFRQFRVIDSLTLLGLNWSATQSGTAS